MAPRLTSSCSFRKGLSSAPTISPRSASVPSGGTDLVGEIDVVDRVVDREMFTGDFDPAGTSFGRPRPCCVRYGRNPCRPCACGCGSRPVAASNSCRSRRVANPAFSFLLDQLHNRGRTRVASSGEAVRLRAAPERRSGFSAGRELYGALGRIAEWRSSSDMGFADRTHYFDPRSEKIALFSGEQMLRYVGFPATRAHVGSFIRGMWAARHEATASRDRIRDDIRNLR